MTVELLIEETPLCVRAARVENDEVTALRHWFPGRETPILGELYRARVMDHDRRLGAAFLEIGGGRKAFLRRPGRLPDIGSRLIVEVKKEEIGGKGADVTDKPVLRSAMASWRVGEEDCRPGPLGERELPADIRGALEDEGPVGRVDPFPPVCRLMLGLLTADIERIGVTRPETKAAIEKELPSGFPLEVVSPADTARFLDEAEEQALARQHGLPGGGRLIIDETEALFTIDLDLGSQGGQSKKGAGTKLLGDALSVLGRLAPIMGLGGQIVIDIPRGAIAAPKIVRDQITRALKPLGRVSVPAVTPEGLSIVIAPRPRPSTLDVLTEEGSDAVIPGRRLRADAAAACAMRAAERALEERRSDTVTLFITNRLRPCLDDDTQAMQVLKDRFGPRLTLSALADHDPRGDFHVG